MPNQVEDAVGRVERLLVAFVQQPKWGEDAVEPEDNPRWRAGYEAALGNLREELKPWWPLGGPLCLPRLLKEQPAGDDAETALHFVCDGPPGPESGRFVECETPDGRSVSAGEWHERPDGYWELRVASRLSIPSEVTGGDVFELCMATGALIVATDGDESIRQERKRALDAMELVAGGINPVIRGLTERLANGETESQGEE